jgi:hypothetical protein
MIDLTVRAEASGSESCLPKSQREKPGRIAHGTSLQPSSSARVAGQARHAAGIARIIPSEAWQKGNFSHGRDRAFIRLPTSDCRRHEMISIFMIIILSMSSVAKEALPSSE